MFFRDVDLPTFADATGGEMIWVGPPAQRAAKSFTNIGRQPTPGKPFSYVIPEMAVAKVRNVVLKSVNSTPYSPQNQVFVTRRLAYRDINPTFHTQAWETQVAGGVEAELGEPVMHITEPAFRLSVGNSNFGHFIWEAVAKCLMLSRIPGHESLKILYPDVVPDRYLAWIEAAGIKRQRLIPIPTEAAVQVDTLFIGTAPFAHDENKNIVLHEESLHDLRRRVWENTAPAPRRERLFFSRSDAAQKRCVNEAEVFALLEPHGFRFLTGANTSQQDLIGYVRNADIIVAPLGAATAAAAIAPADCIVVELTPSPAILGKYNATFGALLLGQPFMRMVGQRVSLPDNTDPAEIYWDYTIDPAHIRDLIKYFPAPSPQAT